MNVSIYAIVNLGEFSESRGMFLITYLTGGVGVSTKILMLKLQDDKVIDLWSGYSFSEFKSKGQVVKYIKKKNSVWSLW